MRKSISPHTENSIGFAIKYYHQYMQQCDNLAKKANELIEGTHLTEYIIDDISCEYSPSVGLVFILELNDIKPHTTLGVHCSLNYSKEI